MGLGMRAVLKLFLLLFFISAPALAQISYNGYWSIGARAHCGSSQREKFHGEDRELPVLVDPSDRTFVDAFGMRKSRASLNMVHQTLEMIFAMEMVTCISGADGKPVWHGEVSDAQDFLHVEAPTNLFRGYVKSIPAQMQAWVDMDAGTVQYFPTAVFHPKLSAIMNQRTLRKLNEGQEVEVNLTIFYGFKNFASEKRAAFEINKLDFNPTDRIQNRMFVALGKEGYLYNAAHGFTIKLQKDKGVTSMKWMSVSVR